MGDARGFSGSVDGWRFLVVGLGVSGRAVGRQLLSRGAHVVAVDDSRGDDVRLAAGELGVELVERPSPDELAVLVAASDVVVPSPGVPPRHPVFALAAARAVPVRSEVELAGAWLSCPLVAVTGTNGKTTVTAMVTEMLSASGRRAVAAGNIGLALSDAVDRRPEVVVAEVSSFQLQFTETFHPAVAVWLNVADDHLDWHPDRASYIAAKARIWANQADGDVAVANAGDPAVLREARRAPAAVVTFGPSPADFQCVEGVLRSPKEDLVPARELWRSLPHDVDNALGAAAAGLASGATLDGVRRTLREFAGLPHRMSLVADVAGVRWYDDSKATNPHATLAAVSALDSVVLIAGGRNKGLDLGQLRAVETRLRSVVAIGEAAPEVVEVFAGRRPVVTAASMEEAVAAAAAVARSGDAVLLSPGCASFDWYRSYGERGDDFTRAARALLGLARPSP